MSKALENFGKYVLLEKIAAGGMAEVYLAKSTGASGINKFVAIKRILPQYSDHPEFIEMFKEEAKIAVNLNHGNVVSIFDFGVEQKQFFLVMEYVEGQNLRQVLNHLKKEERYFSIDQIIFMIKEVAAGLDHAHRCLDGTTGKPLNITHRDISPQNLMVSFEGEIKIVDFGIAKAETQIETTRAGTIKGKFGYMSPEQADGQVVDLRTDIFSLGIVFWELLANDRLFTSNSEAATLRKIRDCQIPSLRKLNPSISPELERIVNKALAKDKSLRYQTAAAFHRDLNRYLNTQYPEFSPHDFSVFMKSVFAVTFMDNRKKLIEYAKVKGSEEATQITSTATLTETEASQVNVEPDTQSESFSQLALSQAAAPVDLSELKRRNPTKVPSFYNSHPRLDDMTKQTDTRRSTRTHLSTSSNSYISAFVVVMLAFAGFFFWKSQRAKNSGLDVIPNVSSQNKLNETSASIMGSPVGSADPASASAPSNTSQKGPQNPVANSPAASQGSSEFSSQLQYYSVIIQSTPSGARISIDGQDTGMITPAQNSVEAGKEFTIALRKEGYQYYERKERASTNGHLVTASLLPMPKMGYINLELINGGSNPVIMINGMRIDEKPPLKNYAVIAGTKVRIEAHNPFTGLYAEQVVTVGTNQRIQVSLILSQRKPSHAQ